MTYSNNNMYCPIRIVGVLLLSMTVMVSSAETFELTVSGEEPIALDVAMAETYPLSSLGEGDTIVKKGAGTLIDSEAALSLDKRLRYEICEGSLVEGVQRKCCTYCVSNGASVEVSLDLRNLASSSADPAWFFLCGAGTADRPGALYLSSATGAANQNIVYNLTGDATIYAKGVDVVFSSYANDSDTVNKFVMNGHGLRFANESASKVFRFRYAVSFIDPGEVFFDTCSVTRLGTGNVNVRDLSGENANIPCVRLVNGAKFNCVNDMMSGKISILDCEAGTQLCKVGSDAPANYTLPCIVGAPIISADQKVTVGCYIARAADVLVGKYLSSAASLGFIDGAGVGIEGLDELEKETTYTLIETTTPITGSADADFPADFATMTIGDTSLTVRRLGDFPPETFVAYVPFGFVRTYAQIVAGHDGPELLNKTLYKIGRGQMEMNVGIKNELGQTALTNLVVAQGVCRLSQKDGLPTRTVDDTHAQRVITVLDGATFKIVSQLIDISSASVRVIFNLAGEGMGGLGALCFEGAPGNNQQRVEYRLAADTTITKCFETCVLSSAGNADATMNVFYMNGHSLTFKNAPGIADGCYRFRYCVTFDTPGTITFDGCGVSHLTGAQVRDRVVGVTQPLPLVRLVNGAKINCVDQAFATAIGVLDCEFGTEICAVNSGTDKPSDYMLGCVRGFPSVVEFERDGIYQKISISNLVVKVADVHAGKSMLATPTLNFADGAIVDIDIPAQFGQLPENGVLIAAATESLTGRPKKGNSFSELPLCLEQDETTLRIGNRKGLVIVVY